jgi:outer membrane receptor protein involved in Fe transport
VVLALVPLSPRAADLLDLPLEDLLQVEVRSASKRWEQVPDIPASVTIMTREEIARYGYATFEELLRNFAGFFILDNTTDRFIGNRGTVGGEVQFLVNGVPQHPARQKALTTPQIARLNIPVESIDRIEVIRGPMSVVYGNNAFLGVINVVTNTIEQNGPRLSASAGTHDSGGLFARAGTASPEGYVVVNAGVSQNAGLDGDYRELIGAQQLAALVPGMDYSMDGRMEQQDLSLDLSAGWRGWNADLRYTEKDYGFYFLTPSFDDGNHACLRTWHAAVGWERAFTDQIGLRASGIVSEEHGKVDEFDFLSPAVDGDQQLQARRWDLELDFYFDLQPHLNLTAGYRFRLVDGIENRAFVPSLVDMRNRVDDVGLHDLFAELGRSPAEPLRLTGGLRLSRLPASYGYTSEDFLNGTRFEDDFPVDDRNLLTGRVAALWSLDAHQVLKLIWSTAA